MFVQTANQLGRHCTWSTFFRCFWSLWTTNSVHSDMNCFANLNPNFSSWVPIHYCLILWSTLPSHLLFPQHCLSEPAGSSHAHLLWTVFLLSSCTEPCNNSIPTSTQFNIYDRSNWITYYVHFKIEIVRIWSNYSN